jgi:hypothetical protein
MQKKKKKDAQGKSRKSYNICMNREPHTTISSLNHPSQARGSESLHQDQAEKETLNALNEVLAHRYPERGIPPHA